MQHSGQMSQNIEKKPMDRQLVKPTEVCGKV